MKLRIVLVVALMLASPWPLAQSPYAGQTARTIKSLSSDDVAELLAGKGMGLAKAAELNGYPGPAHVLELADRLALSPPQRAATEALFARMQADARTVGARLVAEERALDESFAAKTITPEGLAAATAAIAALQGRLREVHLRAHLDQVAILDGAQASRYAVLRGYAAGEPVHRHVH